MSKFSKNRPNTDFAKFQRQPSLSKIQQNIDKLILASKLSSAANNNISSFSSSSVLSSENIVAISDSSSTLNVENVYNCEMEIIESKNEIEGKKELDTIEKFIEPEPVMEPPQPKKIMHLADVVLKIRNQGFLERIKRLKELRDCSNNLLEETI